jgi:hypothetical protein
MPGASKRGSSGPLVTLDRLSNPSAVEERTHPRHIEFDVDRQTVSVSVDRAAEQLSQPRCLDSGGTGLTSFSI